MDKKLRGVKWLFCENCSAVLTTISTFKSNCLDSLALLQELLKHVEDKGEEAETSFEDVEPDKLEVKVEVDSEWDEDEQDSDLDQESEGEHDSNEDQDNIKDEEDEEGDGEQGKRRTTIKQVRARRKRKLRDGEEREKNCHKCTECDKAFPRPANLRNHFLKKHRNAKHCKYCQKAFEDEEEFNNHMEMEQKRLIVKKEKQQKLHVCEVCGLTTKFRSNLVKHMDTQ